ncbi:hypothetical protein ACJJTC_001410 [Scirpophaga incertulas]
MSERRATPLRSARLRCAQSLDLLAGRERERIRRHHTTRSLDDRPVSTVSGDPVFNGTIIGIVTDDSKTEGQSAPSKMQSVQQIRTFQEKEKSDVRKMPRFAIRSWLLGIFNGTRSSDSSLRRAPPLLDRESVV